MGKIIYFTLLLKYNVSEFQFSNVYTNVKPYS
jgi:hypothetical protein